MRALLDNGEIVDFAESFPDFSKLRGEQLPKERADTDVGKVVAFPSNHGASTRIVAVLRMVERLLDKPSKGSRAAFPNRIANELDEFSLQSENAQRSTPNVQ